MKMVEKQYVENFFERLSYDIFVFCLRIYRSLQDIQYLHMNRRGIFTNFWVINEDDEIEHIYKNTNAAGIMTDRGPHLK